MKDILCKNCLGCNLLELVEFKGKFDCEDFCKANETGVDLCKKILKGEQVNIWKQ